MIHLFIAFCLMIKMFYHAFQWFQCMNETAYCKAYDSYQDLNLWFKVEHGVVIVVTWVVYGVLLLRLNKTKKTLWSVSLLLWASIWAICVVPPNTFEGFGAEDPEETLASRSELCSFVNCSLVAFSIIALEFHLPAVSEEGFKKSICRSFICTVCAIYAYFNLVGAWYIFREHTDDTYTLFTHCESVVLVVVTFAMVCANDIHCPKLFSFSLFASFLMLMAAVWLGGDVITKTKTYELFIYHSCMYAVLAVGLFFFDPFEGKKQELVDSNINNDEIKTGLLKENNI